MKKQFFDYMLEIMEGYENVYFLMAGLGYPRVEEFLSKFPDRAFNTEASEQTTLDIAVGLAYAGKIPVVYTISPFLLRGFETIRTYMDHERLHVLLVGAGRDREYAEHDGFSHDETDLVRIFDSLEHILSVKPGSNIEMKTCITKALKTPDPWYINIKRG